VRLLCAVQSSGGDNRNARKLKPWELAVASVLIALPLVVVAVAIPYHRLAQRVDRQLSGPLLNAVDYYSAPELVAVGDPMPPGDAASAMKRSVRPVQITVSNGRVNAILDSATGRRLAQCELKPQLLANLSEQDRAKRMPVHFSDIPPVLVDAILSAEDKRFFEHSGIDVRRIAKAMYVDLRDLRKEQGASTISMQLARNLWLDRDKSWKRKIEEAMMTIHLEHKLSKDQIFERYCNLVYLGGDGAFGINGVGEAARAYFNKDVRKLDLNEAAMIAGLIQRPAYLNPFRFPERARERRDVVLMRMFENGYITREQYEQTVAAPLSLHVGETELVESQYFIDVAAKEAQQKAAEERAAEQDAAASAAPAAVYTTFDPRLQDAAERAISDGMQFVDKQLAARKIRPASPPQVALIALDPHTGEVKALCGGREYAASQLDRVFAKRPPGSVFKPFVYTAALNTAIDGATPVLTPASVVDDSPTTFDFGNQTYSPQNFKHEFMGQVTLREALAHSLNVATIKVAETAGLNNVVAVAREAGMNDDIEATPAVAIGAYQVTPFEIARAYTIFANGGNLVQPAFIDEMRNSGGEVVFHRGLRTRRVLDPRVAFLMVDMLQEVMRTGTAAGVRTRGFRLPAAGKTGTSHDGWFAGFTSNLLCVVWVGFDDYTDLGLEGARSALPIWTEFMSEAARYKEYGDAKPFAPPEGVTQASFDPMTGQLAGPGCGSEMSGYFIDGTQPTTPCTPQEVQITPTADGGVIEQVGAAPMPQPADVVPPSPVPPDTPAGPGR
jgi:penicillin-binding protein 1B